MFTYIPTGMGTVRRYCSNTTRDEIQAQMTTPKARVWTVRPGVKGTGPDLFAVYAETMDEARTSVERTISDVADWTKSLKESGFTVHAGQHAPAVLQFNLWAHVTPAPDWDEATGPQVTVDTVDGLQEALFLADDEAGSVLVLVKGQMEEHPAQALVPRCVCGNPFRVCPDYYAADHS
jgi:hypothetical protein